MGAMGVGPVGMGPVHVVGAGFAGAAAATALADAGVPVVLWEARTTPGGRAGAFTDAVGEDLDTGPHLFLGAYHRTRALLGRLGTGDRLAFQGALRVPLAVDGRRGGLACPGGLPAPMSLVLGLWGLKPLGLSDRLRLLRAGHALRPEAGAPDGETVAAWLDGIGMPPAATRLLWDPLCRAVMNLPPEEADAGPFVRALRVALFGASGDARLGWARGGLGDLLAPLPKHLAARGGELRHARVAALELGDGGRVAALALAGGGRIPVRRVILAVDAFAAQRLLLAAGAAGETTAALGAMWPAPIVSCDLWLDRRCISFDARAPFVGLIPPPGAAPAPAAEWVFDRDDRGPGAGGAGGQRVATVASAANTLADLPAEEVARRAVADLAGHFPAVKGATLVRARVVKERRATVRLTPGLVRPAPGPVPGVPGLHLCGDYTDTGLPATIEGAVASGEAAARAVLGK